MSNPASTAATAIGAACLAVVALLTVAAVAADGPTSLDQTTTSWGAQHRAALWATNRIAAVEGTPASVARGFAVAWSTVWTAVTRVAAARVDDAASRSHGHGRLR